jgi:hypothetical protein
MIAASFRTIHARVVVAFTKDHALKSFGRMTTSIVSAMLRLRICVSP